MALATCLVSSLVLMRLASDSGERGPEMSTPGLGSLYFARQEGARYVVDIEALRSFGRIAVASGDFRGALGS